MILALDFDGTVVDHQYPRVGPDVPGAVYYLREFTKRGGQIILWTMRSDARPNITNPLKDARDWFHARQIPLWAVNDNPEQHDWTASPKVYAHAYIDDAAIGCPLLPNPAGENNRPYVDWNIVGPQLLLLQLQFRSQTT